MATKETLGFLLRKLRVLPEMSERVFRAFEERLAASTQDGVATPELHKWLEGQACGRAHLYEARLLGEWDLSLWLKAGKRQRILREHALHAKLRELWPRTSNFQLAVGTYHEADDGAACLQEGHRQQVLLLERLGYSDEREVTLESAFASMEPSVESTQRIALAVVQVLAALAVAQTSLAFTHNALAPHNVQLLGPERHLRQVVSLDYGRVAPPAVAWHTEPWDPSATLNVAVRTDVVAVVCNLRHAACAGVEPQPGDDDDYFCPGRDVRALLMGTRAAFERSAFKTVEGAACLGFGWLDAYEQQVLADGECHYVHRDTEEPLTAATALLEVLREVADLRLFPRSSRRNLTTTVQPTGVSQTAGRTRPADAQATTAADADAAVREFVLKEDKAQEDTYEVCVGAYKCYVDGEMYHFRVTKLSVRMDDQKRKYYLTLAHGAAAFEQTRYKWACLTLDYTAFKTNGGVAIQYICKPDASQPGQCTVVPAPTTHVLRVLLPLAVRICEHFFANATLSLQDAVTNDLRVDAGETTEEPRLSLSAVKLLTGSSSFSAYGEYGFVSFDKPQDRLNDLVQFFKKEPLGKTMDILCNAAHSDHAHYFALFMFSDVINGETRYGSFAPYHAAYIKTHRLIRDSVKAAQAFLKTKSAALRAQELASIDLDETISENARRLARIVADLPPGQPDTLEIVRAARTAFLDLEWMFLGTFVKRAQLLDSATWSAYAVHHTVGNLVLTSAFVGLTRPPKKVHTSIRRLRQESALQSPPKLKPALVQAMVKAQKDATEVLLRGNSLAPVLSVAPPPLLSSTHYTPVPQPRTPPAFAARAESVAAESGKSAAEAAEPGGAPVWSETPLFKEMPAPSTAADASAKDAQSGYCSMM